MCDHEANAGAGVPSERKIETPSPQGRSSPIERRARCNGRLHYVGKEEEELRLQIVKENYASSFPGVPAQQVEWST